jgi:hypothetical protein
VSAILVLVAFNSFTPAGRQPRRPARVDRGSALPTGTRPEIQARIGAGGMGRQAVGTSQSRLLVDFEVTGLPGDMVAVPVAVRASWSFVGGPTLESKNIGFASGWWHDSVPNQPLFREAIGRLLGTTVVGSADFRQKALQAGSGFELGPLEANRDRPGSLTLDVELLLVRLHEAGRMPIERGREMWAGAHHLVVLPERRDRPMDVRVGHLRPSLLLRGALWHDAASGLSLVALNESLGQAAVSFGGISVGMFGGGLSHVRDRVLSLGYPEPVDPEWLAGAEVAAVTIEPEGMIRRIVRREGVRFDDVPSVDGRGL